MKICSIFHCPLMSRTLVRLPVSNKILSFNKKLGGRCPGISAPEQPRTLTSISFLSNQTISFTSWFELFLRRTPSRISLQTSSRILPSGSRSILLIYPVVPPNQINHRLLPKYLLRREQSLPVFPWGGKSGPLFQWNVSEIL